MREPGGSREARSIALQLARPFVAQARQEYCREVGGRSAGWGGSDN